MEPHRISVVIPVYRSVSTLSELTSRLLDVLGDSLHEVIFVEDGASQASWSEICRLAHQHDEVHGLRLARNVGQHAAVLTGIRKASGDVIVTLDDDLQNPPEEIPKMLAKLSSGFQLVYGVPISISQSGYRSLSSKVIRVFFSICLGVKHAKKFSSFRAFNAKLRDAFDEYRGPSVNVDALLSWATLNVAEVEVSHRDRREGSSGYGFLKLAAHAVSTITAFSIRPLKLASSFGFVTTALGIGLLTLTLLQELFGQESVPGFRFLASLITIFSGVQLLSLGVIGRYLGIIHFRTMGMPPSSVLEVTRSANQKSEPT